MNSPLRRAGSGPHYPTVSTAPGPLMAPIKGSPTRGTVLANVSENADTPASRGGLVQWRNTGGGGAVEWNHPHHPTRAMTLPDFGSE